MKKFCVFRIITFAALGALAAACVETDSVVVSLEKNAPVSSSAPETNPISDPEPSPAPSELPPEPQPVDTTAPGITSVTGPADGTYGADQNLEFTVNLSEAVNVTGTPRLTLTIGATTRNATYLSGSGTSALVFRYTVVSGENDSDGIAVASALGLPLGAMIRDAAGNDLSPLTFTAPSLLSVLVDSTPPNAPGGVELVTPAASPGKVATPVIRVSGVVSGDMVSLHSDSGCTLPALKASATATGATIDLTTSSLAAGTYDFYAKSTDPAGNASACSTAKVTYVYDNIAPSAPSGLALVTPSSSPGKISTPVIRVSGVTTGDTISLHTDNACTSAAKASAVASGTTVDLTSSALSETSYTFYAKATDAAGNASACTVGGLAYRYDITAPSAPSGVALASGTSPSMLPTPSIRVSGVVSGDTISIHTDSSCATGAKASGVATATSIDLISSAVAAGSYTFYAKATDAAGNASACSIANVGYTYDPVLACPANFIKVPGDAGLGTYDFCVSKFEMKVVNGSGNLVPDGAGTWAINGCDDGCGTVWSCYIEHDASLNSAASRPDGTPWTGINRTQAAAECAAMGAGYRLMTNAEWQTIARNVENTGANWTGGSVGSGSVYVGHSDSGFDAGAVAQGLAFAYDSKALAASSGSVPLDDGSGYAGTGQAAGTQRRTHILSNGNVIWDFGGNVREWVSDTINTSSYAVPNQLSYGLPATNNAKLHFGPQGAYGADPGFGWAALSISGGVLVRGGYYSDSAGNAGIFSVVGSYGVGSLDLFLGFRCVKQ